MLSLVELERVAGVLGEELVGARVGRWIEPGRGRLAFSLYRPGAEEGRKIVLEIDARPERAHLGRLPRLPAAPERMPAFTAYLRAHLGRARLEAVRVRGGDRQLELEWSAREGRFRLLLAIFGRRSNLYLLDEQDRLLQSLRPLADTRAELALGEPYADPAGRAPIAGTDRFAGTGGLALLDEIAASYAEEDEARSQDDARRTLLQALKKERRTRARRLERIEAELAEAEEADRLAREGELLKSNLARIEPGAQSVRVEDWETGAPVEIPLDPRRSPRENLDAIFKRYQKLLRRVTKAGGQIDAAQAGLAELEALAEEVEGTPDLAPLLEREAVQALLVRHGRPTPAPGGEARPAAPKPPAAFRDLPRKLHPRRYRSADGLEIWVGRSDEGNDVLTTRLARGKDLFFHLDGAPGSHVVLRTEGRADPPSESLLDACELAVHYSKQKKAGWADVHVAPIKSVKKPRGAKRGLVYVTGGRSIHLRREAGRLERLLASRIED